MRCRDGTTGGELDLGDVPANCMRLTVRRRGWTARVDAQGRLRQSGDQGYKPGPNPAPAGGADDALAPLSWHTFGLPDGAGGLAVTARDQEGEGHDDERGTRLHPGHA